MGFKEEMIILSSQIHSRRQFVKNEETTKHSLIVPFIQILGYDVFNPLEVRPEFCADFGKKKGEKVDYAIISNDVPIIFIEAKAVNENLKNHDAQLSRYFNSTPSVKIAILTNGITYKFFTDISQNNIMDLEPFFEFDILTLNDYSISIMQRFTKEYFDKNEIEEMAKELNNISNIISTLRDLFENPTDEFIKFLIKGVCKDKLTSSVVERFRPIVKKSIKEAVIAIIRQGLFSQDIEIANPSEVEVQSTDKNHNHTNIKLLDEQIEKKIKNHREPSLEELEAFEAIKKILLAYGKSLEELTYKATTNYFAIYNKNINNWFLRLSLDGLQKHLITRLHIDKAESLCSDFKIEQAAKGNGESRILLNSHTDIKSLKSLIVTCFEQS